MQTHQMREEVFTVSSYESDFMGRLSIFSLFDRFQDIAGFHASHLGVGFEELRKSGVAWMLSRVKLKIVALPKWRETVTLRTWPKGVDRLFALRDFRLKDEKGGTLALATTCWFLVDIEKGKPRRIESLNTNLQFPDAEQAISEIPDKIATPQTLAPAYEKQIFASELDVNEHVNNAHYVRWVMDCFDVDWLRSKEIASIQLNYLDQVRCGDRIGISKSENEGLPNTSYVEGTSSKNGSKVFQGLVEWRSGG